MIQLVVWHQCCNFTGAKIALRCQEVLELTSILCYTLQTADPTAESSPRKLSVLMTPVQNIYPVLILALKIK